MRPSFRTRLFTWRLRAAQAVRSIDATDFLTVIALGLLWAGVAMLNVAVACIVAGSLLALLTPVGAAVRILLRGR
jgi:hypothetical protein